MVKLAATIEAIATYWCFKKLLKKLTIQFLVDFLVIMFLKLYVAALRIHHEKKLGATPDVFSVQLSVKWLADKSFLQSIFAYIKTKLPVENLKTGFSRLLNEFSKMLPKEFKKQNCWKNSWSENCYWRKNASCIGRVLGQFFEGLSDFFFMRYFWMEK